MRFSAVNKISWFSVSMKIYSVTHSELITESVSCWLDTRMNRSVHCVNRSNRFVEKNRLIRMICSRIGHRVTLEFFSLKIMRTRLRWISLIFLQLYKQYAPSFYSKYPSIPQIYFTLQYSQPIWFSFTILKFDIILAPSVKSSEYSSVLRRVSADSRLILNQTESDQINSVTRSEWITESVSCWLDYSFRSVKFANKNCVNRSRKDSAHKIFIVFCQISKTFIG